MCLCSGCVSLHGCAEMSLRRLALGTRTGQSEQRQVYQPDKQKPLFYSVRYLIVSSLPLSSMGAARFQNPLQDRRDGMDRHAKFPKGIRRNTNIIALSISIGLAYSMCCTSEPVVWIVRWSSCPQVPNSNDPPASCRCALVKASQRQKSMTGRNRSFHLSTL